MTELPAIVSATGIPVQAVGGLDIDQAVDCVGLGAPVVVFGAPLAIDGEAFAPSKDRAALLGVLREASARVHAAEIRYPGGTVTG